MLKQSNLVHLSAALLCTFSLAACGATPEGEAEVEQTKQAITNGQLLTTGQEPFAVRLVFVGHHGCSGTKIGAKRFLTASHCVWPVPVGNKVKISNEGNGAFLNPDYTITKVFKYPTNNANMASGHYTDVGMFDIQEDTPHISTFTAFRPNYLDQDVPDGWLNAFGCDESNPGRDGHKQFGRFTSKFRFDPPSYTSYIFAQGQNGEIGCGGDSGGALFFVRNGAWEIAGIHSASGNGGTYSARIGRVHRWIQNPTQNVFTVGSKGSLLNFKGNNCIRAGSGTSTALSYCDLRNIPTDTQYWTLEGVGAGRFRIKNTSNGRCLAAASGVLQHEQCSDLSRFVWRFTTPTTKNGFQYYHIQNEGEVSSCIGTNGNNVANDTPLKTLTCSSAGSLDSQVYVFVP